MNNPYAVHFWSELYREDRLREAGEPYFSGHDSMRCRSCGTHLRGSMLETLRSVSALPETLDRRFEW